MSTCWASSLSQCGEGKSKEHIIGKALFPDGVLIRGFDWCKDELKPLGINGLVAKCLCKKHNQDLSELDQGAVDLWKLLQEFMRIGKIRSKINPKFAGRQTYRLDATKIERWCFKVMSNVLSSDHGKQAQVWAPNDDLVRFIFGKGRLPDGCGLGIIAEISENISNADHIAFGTLLRGKELVGCLIGFRGIRMICTFGVKVDDVIIPPNFLTGKTPQGLYHLEKLQFSGPHTAIRFDWSGKFKSD